VRLSPEDRRRAVALSRALERVRGEVAQEGLEAALAAGRRELEEAGIDPDYLEARDAESLTPVLRQNGRPILIAVAARLGDTRLIDNVLIEP
jgi:pantoate--beta-alanine ligase